ncbi:hypothetical protein [Streptomyces sp. NPDC051636]|uniref:hypothetical protein n=1 Tax=Streptomyces sp. NPDC051636 TaxID=3365663 RepID=UPI0037B4A032
MIRIEEFEEVRSLLFSIACRVLGSVSAARDAVEETWLRDESAPTVPVPAEAFPSAEVTRISRNVLRPARVRQDTYAGPWLAGPLPGDAVQNPERPAEPAASLSTAAVPREVSGRAVARTAPAVGCSESACHQRAASVTALSEVGGGTLPRPGCVVGADQVAGVLAAIVPAVLRVGVTVRPQDVDGGSGAVFRDRHGALFGALALDILDRADPDRPPGDRTGGARRRGGDGMTTGAPTAAPSAGRPS